MPDIKDILAIIMEGETSVEKIAEKLKMPIDMLENIIKELSQHNLIVYDQQKGTVKPSKWLVDIGRETENIKAAVGTIILPQDREIRIEEISIGNFTDMDLELNFRFNSTRKEIAICKAC